MCGWCSACGVGHDEAVMICALMQMRVVVAGRGECVVEDIEDAGRRAPAEVDIRYSCI